MWVLLPEAGWKPINYTPHNDGAAVIMGLLQTTIVAALFSGPC